MRSISIYLDLLFYNFQYKFYIFIVKFISKYFMLCAAIENGHAYFCTLLFFT